jgi:hypothetical protein
MKAALTSMHAMQHLTTDSVLLSHAVALLHCCVWLVAWCTLCCVAWAPAVAAPCATTLCSGVEWSAVAPA